MGDDEDVRTIWCGNLSEKVTHDTLYELFYQAGPLDRVRIPRDQEGRQRNFGFVTYTHKESVPYAIELFRGTALFDRKLNMKMQKGSEQRLSNNGNGSVSSDFANMLGRPVINLSQANFDVESSFVKMTNQLMSNNAHSSDSLLNLGVYDQHAATNRLTSASLLGQWTSRHNPDRDRHARRHEPYKDHRDRNKRNDRNNRERDRNDRRFDRGSNNRYDKGGSGSQNSDDGNFFESVHRRFNDDQNNADMRLDNKQDWENDRDVRRRGDNYSTDRSRNRSNDRQRDLDVCRDEQRNRYRGNRNNRHNGRD